MGKMFLFVLLFVSVCAGAQNKSYYVDGVLGKDTNPGTESQPWKSVTKTNSFKFQAGDQLFFAGGQTFGQLQLQANDAGGLTIRSYNGTATLGGLYAYNVGDITIDGVNFRGAGPTGNNVSGIKFYMDAGAPGDLANILIQNVSVTNFGSNGILIGAWDTNNGYNKITVLNSTLYGNGVDGFATYGYNDQVNNTQLYISNVKSYQNYGRTDITSTNTGSGFTIGGVDGGVIENCEAYECGKNNRGSGGGPQGFWCYNSRNILFQYCTSHDNKAGRLYDGGGFDIDGGSQNCTIQYCYSYNNDGAGYAFFEHGSTAQFNNNTIRYNISQNDARANAHGAIMMWAKDTVNRVKNSFIYNNTIYVTPSAIASAKYPVGVFYKWSNFQNLSFFNNIIYTTDTIRTLVGTTTSTTFSNNDYYNPLIGANFSRGGVKVNPIFSNPGGGKAGYVLKAGSPMINTGKAHTVTKDIIGTPVPFNGAYDIGAYESKITPPVANAGSDRTITLPTNSVTLTGSGTDKDGTINAYAWTKTAGPATYTIDAPSNASTAVRNLVQGTYTFRLTVTDDDGAKAFDDVQVVVNAAPPPAGSRFVKVNIYGGTNPYSNTEWTNWNVGTTTASNKSISALKYADGGASTVGALLSRTDGMGDNGATYGGTMAPPEVLRYCSSSAPARTLTLSGLSAAKTYNLELYASRAKTGYTTIFTAGGKSVSIVTDNNKSNLAVFSNLTPDGTGKIVVNIQSGTSPNATAYNYINGFVLMEAASTAAITKSAMKAEANEVASSQLQVHAFPNPSSNQFTLQLSGAVNQAVQVRVVDVMGRIVEEKGRVPANSTLTIGRSYSPGVYYAQVIQGARHTMVKLVKQPQK